MEITINNITFNIITYDKLFDTKIIYHDKKVIAYNYIDRHNEISAYVNKKYEYDEILDLIPVNSRIENEQDPEFSMFVLPYISKNIFSDYES